MWGFYRDKQGLAPTGILIHKARANGLASAAELLEVEGHDKFSYQKKPKLVMKTITRILIFFLILVSAFFVIVISLIYGFFLQDVASMEGTSGNNDSVPETEVAVAGKRI